MEYTNKPRKEGSCKVFNFFIDDDRQIDDKLRIKFPDNKVRRIKPYRDFERLKEKIKSLCMNFVVNNDGCWGDIVNIDYFDLPYIFDGKTLIKCVSLNEYASSFPSQEFCVKDGIPANYWYDNNDSEVEINNLVWFDQFDFLDTILKNIKYALVNTCQYAVHSTFLSGGMSYTIIYDCCDSEYVNEKTFEIEDEEALKDFINDFKRLLTDYPSLIMKCKNDDCVWNVDSKTTLFVMENETDEIMAEMMRDESESISSEETSSDSD